MRFGGEVVDEITAVHGLAHRIRVGDVTTHELEARIVGDGLEILEVARVRELVEHDDARVIVFPHEEVYEVAADEAGAPRDQNSHERPPSSFENAGVLGPHACTG